MYSDVELRTNRDHLNFFVATCIVRSQAGPKYQLNSQNQITYMLFGLLVQLKIEEINSAMSWCEYDFFKDISRRTISIKKQPLTWQIKTKLFFKKTVDFFRSMVKYKKSND